MTLSGAQGRDLELLIAKGIISRTEAGTLTQDSAERVAAIEMNSLAVTELLLKFPGLKVHNHKFEHLVHGLAPTRFPTGNDEKLCRSAVINLDMNCCFESRIESGTVTFPLVDQIHKLSLIHIARSKVEWSLLVTLHGELHWSSETWQYVAAYLLENLRSVSAFREAATIVWGADIVADLDGNKVSALANAKHVHQRLVLTLLPKLIADKVRDQRWAIHIDWSFVYGGGSAAPMVTWAIDFKNPDTRATPATMYAQNVGRILEKAGYIDENGNKKTYLA